MSERERERAPEAHEIKPNAAADPAQGPARKGDLAQLRRMIEEAQAAASAAGRAISPAEARTIFATAMDAGVSPADYREFVSSLRIDQASQHALLAAMNG